MKYLKTAFFVLASFGMFLMPGANVKSFAPVVTPEEMTIDEMIADVSPRFKQDPLLISKVSYCESKHKEVVHDGGYGKGVTGIHKKTFEYWLPKYAEENGESLNYDSSYDQLKMMAWAFSKGDAYRNQWTTYVAYENGGTYSFYSNLLKARFTVHCK